MRGPGIVFIRLERTVNEHPRLCSWCSYPMWRYSSAYTLRVDGRSLGVVFCSERCAQVEARAKGRGQLGLRYACAA